MQSGDNFCYICVGTTKNMQAFNILLITMAVLAVVVFVALFFVDAGYGMLIDRKWGKTISNKAGWVVMEAPVFILMTALWLMSDRRCEIVPLCFLFLFQLHYFQRAFVFPFLLKGRGRMPISIIAMGIVFNTINAAMQGGWIFYLSPAEMYSAEWLATPQFVIGVIVFFAGMFINMQSDYIIRHLRKEGDTKHYIPYGGMFRWVSSANYFGEFVEWVGFAVLTWSWSGAVFALWTFANLAPRAVSLRKRYEAEFGDEFRRLHRKSIIPFIF